MKQLLGKSYFFKFKMLIVFSVMFLSFPVMAISQKEEFANLLIKCFHTNAVYESLELPDFPKPKSSTPTQTTVTLRFKGSFTGVHYVSKFTVYTRLMNRKVELKIELEESTAFIPYIPGTCPLEEWH